VTIACACRAAAVKQQRQAPEETRKRTVRRARVSVILICCKPRHESGVANATSAANTRSANARGCEEIAEIAGLTDGSVCPHIASGKGWRFFVGQALPPATDFSQSLTLRGSESAISTFLIAPAADLPYTENRPSHMLVLQLALLLCLLLVCSLAPGFYCVRRLPWTPGEALGRHRLVARPALSRILGHLLLHPAPDRPAPFRGGVSDLCPAGHPRPQRPRSAAPFVSRSPRALGSGLPAPLAMVILAMIRITPDSAGRRLVEHFQRSLFFLHRFPPIPDFGRL